MIYLEDDDLKTFIQEDQLDQITEGLAEVKDTAEKFALAMVTSYLSGRYSMDTEFAKTGTARNFDLVRNVTYITIYFINERVAPRSIPQIRIDSYGSAENWLDMVNKGKLNLQIDKITPSQTVPITYGSNPRPNNSY